MVASAQAVPPHMQAVEPETTPEPRSAFWFSIAFVLAELLALVATVCLAVLPLSTANLPFPWNGYGHRVTGMTCDVLLYGDSTALAALDPAVFQRTTSMKTCNISETRPVEEFVGNYFPLDDYLAHNATPKYLVTAWSPSGFKLDRQPRVVDQPEGFDYAMRYDRAGWLWAGLLRKPSTALNLLVAEQAQQMSVAFHSISRRLTGNKKPGEGARRDGQLGMWAIQNPPETACVGAPKDLEPSSLQEDEKGVAAFRQRYEARGIHVVVDVAPIPDCSADLKKSLALIQGLYENEPDILPIEYFNDRDIHVTPKGAALFSEQVANQLATSMQPDRQTKPESQTKLASQVKP